MSNLTSAEVVAHSISPALVELATLEVTMHPRAVEHFLTHRRKSRNGASRRAIPVRKQIEDVRANPCFPVKFGLDQPGMISGDALSGIEKEVGEWLWLKGRDAALEVAEGYARLGVHKEVATAGLHPYQWRTYLVSATEWDNFFEQRLGAGAQGDIRLLAEKIQEALEESTPRPVAAGEWHLPYIDEYDVDQCDIQGLDVRVVSAMRCARVSYLSHPVLDEAGNVVVESKRSCLEDHAKGNGLAVARHWSPFEHPATPASPFDETANFQGWQQLRTQMGA